MSADQGAGSSEPARQTVVEMLGVAQTGKRKREGPTKGPGEGRKVRRKTARRSMSDNIDNARATLAKTTNHRKYGNFIEKRGSPVKDASSIPEEAQAFLPSLKLENGEHMFKFLRLETTKEKVPSQTEVYKCEVCKGHVKLGRNAAQRLAEHVSTKRHIKAVKSRESQKNLAARSQSMWTSSTSAGAASGGSTTGTPLPQALPSYVSAVTANLPRARDEGVFNAHVLRTLYESHVLESSVEHESFADLICGRCPVPVARVTRKSLAAVRPRVLEEEKMTLQREIRGLPLDASDAAVADQPVQQLALVFDESDLYNRHASALVARFVNRDQWLLESRVVDFRSYDDGLDSVGVGQAITTGLEKVNASCSNVVAIIGDACATQVRAMVGASSSMASGTRLSDDVSTIDLLRQHISASSPTPPLVIACYSHLLNNAGKRLTAIKRLDEFATIWSAVVKSQGASSTSKKSWNRAIKAYAKEKMMTTEVKYRFASGSKWSKTRWFGKWETLVDVFDFFEVLTHSFDVVPLEDDSGWKGCFARIDTEAVRNLRSWVSDAAKLRHLRRDLATLYLFGEPLVTATYDLESSSFIQPRVCSILGRLRERLVETLTAISSLNNGGGIDAVPERIRVIVDSVWEDINAARDPLGRADFASIGLLAGYMFKKAASAYIYVGCELGMLSLDSQKKIVTINSWPGGDKAFDGKTFGITSDMAPTRRSSAARVQIYSHMSQVLGLTRFLDPRVAVSMSKEEGLSLARALVKALPSNVGYNETAQSRLLSELGQQWGAYVEAAAEELNDANNILKGPSSIGEAEYGRRVWDWWGFVKDRGDCSAFVDLVAVVAILSPSSSDAERSFSSMGHAMGKRQGKTSDDGIQARVMVGQNTRARSAGERRLAKREARRKAWRRRGGRGAALSSG